MDSPRELHPEQILAIRLMAEGMSDRQIARQLSLSVSSVQRRLRAASEQFGSKSRVQLAVTATRLGLLDGPIDVDDTDSRAPAGRTER